MKSTAARPAYSVVLPVFNEAENVWHIVKRYEAINKNTPIELLFVEDTGSSDNTRAELEKIAVKYPFVKNVFTTERGYGVSIYNGLKAATAEYVCWTHADLQTDPEDTRRAYELIRAQSDPKKTFVKGRRYGRPITDVVFTFGMSLLETVYLGTSLFDINAQPNFFHQSALALATEPPRDFSFDLYFYYLARTNGFKIVRFPVAFRQRLYGNSAWNLGFQEKWKFIKRTWKFSVELKKRLKQPAKTA